MPGVHSSRHHQPPYELPSNRRTTCFVWKTSARHEWWCCLICARVYADVLVSCPVGYERHACFQFGEVVAMWEKYLRNAIFSRTLFCWTFSVNWQRKYCSLKRLTS
ncbi:hypothetical protein Tcan_02651 [Toxocara canis]|uniref:Uncharacterized protein n=1 Tax=Toxocara canis TaxID=6265 RepID=A0A0B2V2A2_TOXCA|nr:hypothetical protein Tcan_02651 [Toxocara canis]